MTYTHEGEEFLTIKEFCKLTNRTTSAARYLIIDGNKIRKLRAIKVDGEYFIAKEELFIFPFTDKGKTSNNVYHFNEKMELQICPSCSEGLLCPKIEAPNGYEDDDD